MSIAATAWAWSQEIPLKPKFVLVKLADQTDERSGRVCYGKTDLEYLAAKCSMPRRSLTRCIAALITNSYMIRESGKGKGTPSQYWLCLGREPATSIDEFVWSAADETQETEGPDDAAEETETQALEGVGQIGLPPSDTSQPQNGLPGGPTNGLPGGPIRGPLESLTKEQSYDHARVRNETKGFSKRKQDLDRSQVKQEREQAKPARYFVIEGTRAWDAWVAEMRRRTRLSSWHLTAWGTHEGKQRRGWYFPSLFPPAHKPTAPPGELSDDDVAALTGT